MQHNTTQHNTAQPDCSTTIIQYCLVCLKNKQVKTKGRGEAHEYFGKVLYVTIYFIITVIVIIVIFVVVVGGNNNNNNNKPLLLRTRTHTQTSKPYGHF